jgi:hypothetical protein
MTGISILGTTKKPTLKPSLDGEDLRFQIEYYARGASEGDFEFIQTVQPEEYLAIVTKFGLDPDAEILLSLRHSGI